MARRSNAEMAQRWASRRAGGFWPAPSLRVAYDAFHNCIAALLAPRLGSKSIPPKYKIFPAPSSTVRLWIFILPPLIFLQGWILANPSLEEIERLIERRELEPRALETAHEKIQALLQGSTAAFAQAQCLLARVLIFQGEDLGDRRGLPYYQKAEAAAEAALKKNKKAACVKYWLAFAMLHQAEFSPMLKAVGLARESVNLLKDVLALGGEAIDDGGAYRMLGRILWQSPPWPFGDPAKAVEYLENARRIAPNSLMNRLYLADAYLKAGRPLEARGELNWILKAPVSALHPKEDEIFKKEANLRLAKMGRVP